MAEYEKEKETLNSKLADSQAKLLMLEKKERQWEVDVQILRNSETKLKVRLAAKEVSSRDRMQRRKSNPRERLKKWTPALSPKKFHR